MQWASLTPGALVIGIHLAGRRVRLEETREPSAAHRFAATPALLCAVPGVFLRLEVTELLLALFFAFYSYRLYAATRA